MVDVFVGLGSNIEPERNIGSAIRRMRRAFGELRLSPVYRCPAFGMRGADFLNLVAAFESTLPVAAIETILTDLEFDSGRVRTDEVVSRTLDLDLLLYGARVDPDERLPRDDVLRYPFVLRPLADIEPAGVHPVTGETFASAWRRMASGGHDLRRVGVADELAASTASG